MGSTKIQFDYCKIEEAAKEITCSVEDLLRLGSEGKLQFLVRLQPEDGTCVQSIIIKCSNCKHENYVPKYSSMYILSVNYLKSINENKLKRLCPILLCEKCGYDCMVTYNLVEDIYAGIIFDPDDIDYIYPCGNELYIYCNDKIKLEESSSEDTNKYEKEECLHCIKNNSTEESFPRLKENEDPKDGLVQIADYLGLSCDYLKRVWKKKNCPINKGRKKKLYAFPSQLDRWLSGHPTKE